MKILITGASGGMGTAIHETFIGSSHTLFLQYHKEKPKVHEGCILIKADLSRESDIQTLLTQIQSNGGCETIIHSVSLPTNLGLAVEKDWENFESHLNTQVKSLFLIVKHLIPTMKKKKFGRIIALASEYTVGRPPAKLADYITAKYALVGLIKSLAVELGPDGITANCISPGLTQTTLTSHLPNKLKEIIAEQTPRKMLTDTKDVASLVAFLSSPKAGMITGENIVINGGYSMR